MTYTILDKTPEIKVMLKQETKILQVTKQENKIVEVNISQNKLIKVIEKFSEVIKLDKVIYQHVSIVDTTNLSVQKFVLRDDNIGLDVYAEDGITLIFRIDGQGNVGTKGIVYSL